MQSRITGSQSDELSLYILRQAVRVIKYRYIQIWTQDMDPAAISVPKVHLKAATMKHVLQTGREENN